MGSYFAGTFPPAFPLRADLRPQRPFAPDFVCGQLCQSDSNFGEGGTFFYSSMWNLEFGRTLRAGLLNRRAARTGRVARLSYTGKGISQRRRLHYSLPDRVR